MSSRDQARRPKFVQLLRTTRPHQWIKNVLVLLPLVAAHRTLDASVALPSLLALIAMVFASSAVYVMNDLVDATVDRVHPTKFARPIARGDVTRRSALALFGFLVLMLLAIVPMLPAAFAWWVLIYIVVSAAYSLKLKRYAIIDVLTLAVLYTIRIMAGGATTALVISPWLLALSMFFFFSLALLKRYAELLGWPDDGTVPSAGRDYGRSDLQALGMIGIASGLLSVLVLALYITSGTAMDLYSSSAWLWGLCVLLLYWICHVWLCAMRGKVRDDPVWFALSDRVSLVVAALMIGVMLAAT